MSDEEKEKTLDRRELRLPSQEQAKREYKRRKERALRGAKEDFKRMRYTMKNLLATGKNINANQFLLKIEDLCPEIHRYTRYWAMKGIKQYFYELIREFQRSDEFPAPIVSGSGNGYKKAEKLDDFRERAKNLRGPDIMKGEIAKFIKQLQKFKKKTTNPKKRAEINKLQKKAKEKIKAKISEMEED